MLMEGEGSVSYLEDVGAAADDVDAACLGTRDACAGKVVDNRLLTCQTRFDSVDSGLVADLDRYRPEESLEALLADDVEVVDPFGERVGEGLAPFETDALLRVEAHIARRHCRRDRIALAQNRNDVSGELTVVARQRRADRDVVAVDELVGRCPAHFRELEGSCQIAVGELESFVGDSKSNLGACRGVLGYVIPFSVLEEGGADRVDTLGGHVGRRDGERLFAGEHRYRRLARGGRIRLLARLRVDNPYAQIAARGLHANVIEPLVIVDAGTSGAELRIFSFQSGSMFSRCALCGVGSTRPVAKPSSSSISAGGIDVGSTASRPWPDLSCRA